LTIAVERHFYLPGLFAAQSRSDHLAARVPGAPRRDHRWTGVHAEPGRARVRPSRARPPRRHPPTHPADAFGGGVAIVEGRYADARGAALFAAGGRWQRWS
jgi:hypothetical protein